jgi:cell wall-associated NlpC family hydrolase
MNFKAFLTMAMIRLLGNVQCFTFQPLFFVFFGSTHYKIKGPEMRRVMENLQPGDILLRRYDRYLSRWFIPGFYKHAAIASSQNSIVHATTYGIFEEDILTFTRADEVAVLRIKDLKPGEAQAAVDVARAQVGKPYDFLFKNKTKDKRFCCTTLVSFCFSDRFEELKKRRSNIVPDDYFHQGLQVIHDSRQYREEHT